MTTLPRARHTPGAAACLASLALLSCSSAAYADAEAPASTTARVPRSWRLGVSVASPVGDRDVFTTTGLGFTGVYAYDISQRSQLGIRLAYHHFDETLAVHQLSYGLRLRHNLLGLAGDWAEAYVAYGLQMQMLKKAETSGSPTAHDTEMAVGLDVKAGKPWFVEVGYHYSKWRPFAGPALNLSFVQLTGGWVFL